MKRCLHCRLAYSTTLNSCPECGAGPEKLGQIWAFAPALTPPNDGFKATFFENLAALEIRNFWFHARSQLILWALHHHASGFRTLLEVGCGTGFVLSNVARDFPHARLFGGDTFMEGLKIAKERVANARLMQFDVRDVPFLREFDVVGAFDVLENTDSDQAVLLQLREALQPSGILVLTAPQHTWIASSDDVLQRRRYNLTDLHHRVQSAGFKILRSTSFLTMSSAVMPSRFGNSEFASRFDPKHELHRNPNIGVLSRWMLKLGLFAIAIGLDLPFGGTRLIVARRVND